MPHLGPIPDARNQAFQKLKPACIAVSQAILSLNGPESSVSDLASKLVTLQQIIKSFPASNNPLDEKLADYIFFPLSHVLKFSQKVSLQCLETTLEILAVLIEHGWRQKIRPQLATQIWILCTLLASEKPTGLASTETTPELRTAALNSLKCLFHAFDAEAKKKLQGEQNVPQVGQTISTTLDALVGIADPRVQIAAVDALEALIHCIDDGVYEHEMLAGFLPGIVSKLTRVLKPQTKQRRDHVVLVKCLRLLELILTNIFNEETYGALTAWSKRDEARTTSTETASRKSILDQAWYEAAAVQIKAALISILRLREHERDDVRSALAELCLVLLNECQNSLPNCTVMAMETLTALSIDSENFILSELIDCFMNNDALRTVLQQLLHDWLQSLPRIMQSADDQAKTKRLQEIRIAYKILTRYQADSALIDRAVAKALGDSVVITIQEPRSQQQRPAVVQPLQTFDLTVTDGASRSTEFGSALVRHRGQEDVMKKIGAFIEVIAQRSTSQAFIADVARSLRQSQGEMEIATFWMLYTAVKIGLEYDSSADEFLIEPSDHSQLYHNTLEELYSHALTILTSAADHPADPRLQSLALRTLALRATTAGPDFRSELIDALYPVLHTLATPDAILQQDSITTLNILTSTCNYTSTQDLIVSNVDYLTNAVALKLNAFDVSPQAPQVLLMMVRLAGPSLLSYLEDTIESIFAALEDFHGYPVLVELLFRVLKVVAEEGAKAPLLAVEDRQKAIDWAGDGRWQPMSMGGLKELLKDRVAEQTRLAEEEKERKKSESSHPREPWKDLKPADDDESDNKDENELSNPDQNPNDDEPDPPPAPKTYSLLLRISDLTQHHLPSSSPSLRTSLLDLLRTTIPALARHENSFLPLINTLWPEITARLDDDETHVRASALEVVAMLCEYAGSFMRSRVRTFWPILREIHAQVVKEIKPAPAVRAGKAKSPSISNSLALTNHAFTSSLQRAAEYGHTSVLALWESLISVLVAVVRYVPIDPEIFDEALGIVGPVLRSRKDVRLGFESVNGDAVWLALVRGGNVEEVERPASSEDGTQGAVWPWAEVV
jgi:hypothetical protein